MPRKSRSAHSYRCKSKRHPKRCKCNKTRKQKRMVGGWGPPKIFNAPTMPLV